MNKGKLYNILSKKKSLSKEDINASLKGKSNVNLSDYEEFDQEALEGWQESGLEKINMSRVNKRLGFSGSPLNYLLAAGITLLLLIVVIWPYLNSESNSRQNFAMEDKNFIEETDIFIAEKFDTLVEEKKTTDLEIVALKRTQQTQPKITETREDFNPTFVIGQLPFKPIERDKSSETIQLTTRKKIKEIFFHTFKLADYRTIRNKPSIETRQLNITGTSANLDSANQFHDDLVWQKIDVPYIDYLEKTMFYMNQGSVKKALARFDVILETYSDDINALFYSGFAFYTLHEFEKSKNKFEKVLQSKISNFDEEAIWYLALSYEQSGEISKAKDLFKSIASSESFYAEMARTKL